MSDPQSRYLKLLALSRGLVARRTGDFTFSVPSFTNPGWWHGVDLLRGTCSCPATKLCTHIVLAEDEHLFETDYDKWFEEYAINKATVRHLITIQKLPSRELKIYRGMRAGNILARAA
jgi:hypothetical protein